MKYLHIIIVSICILLLPGSFAYAGDLTIGATAWYTGWQWEDTEDDSKNYDIDHEFMSGPFVSYRVTDTISLSSLFLYGEFTIPYGDGIPTSRYDSDTAITLRFATYFRAFAGVKLIGYNYEIDSVVETRQHGIGPGFGIGLSVPLVNNFHVMSNISGMYLWGTRKETQGSNPEEKLSLNSKGYNGTAMLGWFLPEAHLMFTIGYRHQWYMDEPEDKSDATAIENTFSGVTLAASYTFRVGGAKKQDGQSFSEE